MPGIDRAESEGYFLHDRSIRRTVEQKENADFAEEPNMRKILPAILILLGILEMIIAFMDIKKPLISAVVLGVLFIAFGVKALLDSQKKG